MPPEKKPEKSKIDRLDASLYSRTRYKNPLETRTAIKSEEPISAATAGATAHTTPAWQGGETLDQMLTQEMKPSNRMPFLKKFFIFAALFFLATLVVAGFVFFGGSNFISSQNVNIEATGPTQAPAGSPVELQVTVSNKNNADLDDAEFSIQYPQGARSAEDSSQALTFSKEDLGVMKAGHEVERTLKFVLIGQTGEQKELKFSVQYRVAGSNATFYKDKTYDITIGNSPLSLSIAAPTSVTSGNAFTTTVSVTLNSTDVLKNVMLRGEYPYGYTETDSNPDAFADNNVWALGDLAPGATKKVTINGTLTGENGDERTFRFYAGAAEGDSPSANFTNVILSSQKTIAVARPSLGLGIAFNNENTQSYVAPAGQTVNVAVKFQNNLAETLVNPKLVVALSGSSLDPTSVAAFNSGFYDSTGNRLTWNILNGQNVAQLAPGDNNTVSFRLASLKALPAGRGSDITLAFTLSGSPVSGGTPVSVTETRTIKIASQVNLSAKALYSTGPFRNTGPIPPKAGATTTYSVVWTLGNTQNDITGAKVTARLGSAVTWLLAKSAQSENISYDATTNTVTWNVGTLASGMGFTQALREVDFQVSLTPSISQVGIAPTLVSGIVFTGMDTATQQNVTLSTPGLTTATPNDPAFIQGDDIVVK